VAAGIRGADAMSIVMPIVLVISVGIPTLFFKFSDGTSHHLFNWCCPKAVLQSHSGWHIVSAVLILVAYDFFASFAGDGRIFFVCQARAGIYGHIGKCLKCRNLGT